MNSFTQPEPFAATALCDSRGQLNPQAIGWSPFGIDFTRYSNWPLGARRMDAETLAPIAGAKVTLYFNNAPVPDSWLNIDLGHPNGSLTGPDGAYAYLFDPATAQSGVYTIVVEKTGYKPSEVYPANPQMIAPDLGGGGLGRLHYHDPADLGRFDRILEMRDGAVSTRHACSGHDHRHA